MSRNKSTAMFATRRKRKGNNNEQKPLGMGPKPMEIGKQLTGDILINNNKNKTGPIDDEDYDNVADTDITHWFQFEHSNM